MEKGFEWVSGLLEAKPTAKPFFL